MADPKQDKEKQAAAPSKAPEKATEKPAEKPEEKPKRSSKKFKNITSGIAHIQASFNNTIVTITDKAGNEIIYNCPPERFKNKYKQFELIYEKSENDPDAFDDGF